MPPTAQAPARRRSGAPEAGRRPARQFPLDGLGENQAFFDALRPAARSTCNPSKPRSTTSSSRSPERPCTPRKPPLRPRLAAPKARAGDPMTNRGFSGNDPGGRSGLLQAIRTDVTLHLRGGLYVIGLVVSVLLALPLALLVPVTFLTARSRCSSCSGSAHPCSTWPPDPERARRRHPQRRAGQPAVDEQLYRRQADQPQLLVLFETVIPCRCCKRGSLQSQASRRSACSTSASG